MKKRFINAAVFLILYLVFLSWYDGWGMDPYTPEEVEALASKAEALETNPEQIRNLRRLLKDDDGKEFFMLNLNRYEYGENEVQQGVPIAYQNYGQAVITMILKNAGHPIYSGELSEYLVGGDLKEGNWHEVILVRYRSRRDFIGMVTSDEYLKISKHRAGGIEYAEVTPTSATINLATPRIFVLVLLLFFAWAIDILIKKNINMKR